jgi:twitching motility protein PilU
VISEDAALRNADSVNNLKLKIKLHTENGALQMSGQVLSWELDPIKHDESDPFF